MGYTDDTIEFGLKRGFLYKDVIEMTEPSYAFFLQNLYEKGTCQIDFESLRETIKTHFSNRPQQSAVTEQIILEHFDLCKEVITRGIQDELKLVFHPGPRPSRIDVSAGFFNSLTYIYLRKE
jgi:hypothetical protein